MLHEWIRHPLLTARFIARRVGEIPSKGLPRLRRPATVDDFDRKYGVETAKIVQVTPTDSPNFKHGSRYQASDETVIRWCIENCALPFAETTFVDIGCGKGRALIVAAAYGFKKVVGVEYSRELAEICQQNLERLALAGTCEVVVGDAVDYRFPAGNLFVFFYNPFDGTILKKVLKNIEGAAGPVRIGNFGPGHEVIQASGMARELLRGEHATLYEAVSAAANNGARN